MAQYDVLIIQNASAGAVEYTENLITAARGGLITFGASAVPTILSPGTNGYVLKSAGAGADLYWDSLKFNSMSLADSKLLSLVPDNLDVFNSVNSH